MYRRQRQNEITPQEQQENSNQVIENMQEFSAEAVSGLDNP
jgi:hypothetical protein